MCSGECWESSQRSLQYLITSPKALERMTTSNERLYSVLKVNGALDNLLGKCYLTRIGGRLGLPEPSLKEMNNDMGTAL